MPYGPVRSRIGCVMNVRGVLAARGRSPKTPKTLRNSLILRATFPPERLLPRAARLRLRRYSRLRPKLWTRFAGLFSSGLLPSRGIRARRTLGGLGHLVPHRCSKALRVKVCHRRSVLLFRRISRAHWHCWPAPIQLVSRFATPSGCCALCETGDDRRPGSSRINFPNRHL